MKIPVNSEVYGVLVLFDTIKVLEAGVLKKSLRPLLKGLPITFKWSATELDTFNTFLTLFEVILCRSLVECYLTLLS